MLIPVPGPEKGVDLQPGKETVRVHPSVMMTAADGRSRTRYRLLRSEAPGGSASYGNGVRSLQWPL